MLYSTPVRRAIGVEVEAISRYIPLAGNNQVIQIRVQAFKECPAPLCRLNLLVAPRTTYLRTHEKELKAAERNRLHAITKVDLWCMLVQKREKALLSSDLYSILSISSHELPTDHSHQDAHCRENCIHISTVDERSERELSVQFQLAKILPPTRKRMLLTTRFSQPRDH